MRTLWVVCPTFFDVPSCSMLLERVRAVVSSLGAIAPGDLRFVVIDDSGGQDPEVSRLEAAEDVHVIRVPFNLGHQRALVFGLRAMGERCRPDDWVVTMDSDGQDRPEDLPRMLDALSREPPASTAVVLAWRTSRRESLAFAGMYLVFKVLFRVLTGTVIKTGNFAAFHGRLNRQVLWHPHFDLAYSSALLSLSLETVFVPCPRGGRYAGQSRMGMTQLIMHGLRMLMPWVDRIATRALILFGAMLAATCGVASAILMASALGERVPAWAWTAVLWSLLASIVTLGHFLVLFVTFAAVSGPTFRALSTGGPSADDGTTRGTPQRTD